jgi:hypothetical protein
MLPGLYASSDCESATHLDSSRYIERSLTVTSETCNCVIKCAHLSIPALLLDGLHATCSPFLFSVFKQSSVKRAFVHVPHPKNK